MSSENAQQVKDWNGRSGERWVEHQDWLDAMLAPFGGAAIEASGIAQGQHVVDIGCGAGTTSFALADRVGPTGHVLGIDISEPLIDRARERATTRTSVEFRLGDASRTPLPSAGFDLLFSRFGVMFFDDPVAAFWHLRSALRPGGRLAFACWRGAEENDWVRLPMGAIRDIVPPAPPPPLEAPGPFSFGDCGRVADILGAAGFSDIGIKPFDHEIVFGRGATRSAAIEDAVHMASEVGPLSRVLADQPAAIRDRALDAVHAAFARRAKGDTVIIDGAAWIVTARG
jgi:SAM-dependent methyltransferase